MIKKVSISDQEIDKLFKILHRNAESSGYHLNKDMDFTRDLIKSLIINQNRYGYMACPCRLASGNKSEDLDIICPCDYRDPDLDEYDTCFCALYVSKKVLDGTKKINPIPERRPPKNERNRKKDIPLKKISSLSKPVWRCKVCGYLCGRDSPPEVCPICKAKKDRFELFI